ncbi:hypothetical protein M3672_00865 [Microbacterium enclense]|uniref:hypothetical protein n=1 Tax=Microbacterium enclense TaxID=993073 RepID=UPI002040093E|nr:hypothetical protein [Microbacterium enclense]MCM3612987.1 hypothetical protein [Microbacterium enclense]
MVDDVGFAPDYLEISVPDSNGAEALLWAQRYGVFIPASREPALAVHRVVLTVTEFEEDKHLVRRTPDMQLAELVSPWFDRLRTWVEVVTGQDLDPGHRVYDANSVGVGLTFLDPPHDGALGLTITTPHVLPVTATEWEYILKVVRVGDDPPLEEILSRDARASQRRGASRRAIIEAATAVEIALGRFVKAKSMILPAPQQKRVNDRTALGDYISIADDGKLPLAVSFDRLRDLNKRRNDAAHRGEAPSDRDTVLALQVMIDFLGAHGALPRKPQREPDGGEFELLSEPV